MHIRKTSQLLWQTLSLPFGVSLRNLATVGFAFPSCGVRAITYLTSEAGPVGDAGGYDGSESGRSVASTFGGTPRLSPSFAAT
jgi:hypothetical protein